jgi:hypothetical protein
VVIIFPVSILGFGERLRRQFLACRSHEVEGKFPEIQTLANFLEFQHSSKVAECTMSKTKFSQQIKPVVSLPRLRVECFSLTREDQGEAELSYF